MSRVLSVPPENIGKPGILFPWGIGKYHWGKDLGQVPTQSQFSSELLVNRDSIVLN